MAQYLIDLFQNMSVLTAVLLGAGMLLCIIEVFVPKIGLAGLLGIALLGSGFSSYYIDGFKLKQIVSLLSIIALVLALFIMIELILESKGIIKNPNRYKFRNPALTTSPSELLGKIGKAYTNIDMGGTIDVDGKLHYAISNEYIAQGSLVEVVGVQGTSLVVIKK